MVRVVHTHTHSIGDRRLMLSNLNHRKVMRVGYAAIISSHLRAAMRARQIEGVNALKRALERLSGMESSTTYGGSSDGS